MRFWLLVLFLCLETSVLPAGTQSPRGQVIGSEVSGFSLRNVDGRMISLKDYENENGLMVVFTCNHCPFARLYTQRFNELSRKYRSKGVPLIAVNPMDSLIYSEESYEEMQSKAKREHFDFPYLQDANQELGRAFNVEHTPQAFVLWKTEGKWIIRYSGAIDDNGEHPELANPWLGTAVDQLLDGKTVQPDETPSFGCRVFYRKE